MANEFYELLPTGKLRYHPHWHQHRAWESTANIVAIISGNQSGKTIFGPPWMHREIKDRGPGDYMVVTPTLKIARKKVYPEFQKLFERYLNLGKMVFNPAVEFRFSEEGQKKIFGASGPDYTTTVHFGYASDPDSLESATIKALWADEAGQKAFKLGSWQALERRCAIHQARKLITTTPYFRNWLKTEISDKADADPDIDVIGFRSIDNPAYPREEYEKARRNLPAWKFKMFYEGIFTQPAGLIYDIYDEETHKVKAYEVPHTWPRMVGIDPFGAYIAAVWLAFDPESSKLVVYREYRAEFGKTTPGHAKAILELSKGENVFVWAGGGPSERQARADFAGAGIPLQNPGVTEVWSGIDRVYQLLKSFDLVIMDNCPHLLSEAATYQRIMDEDEATDKIDDKEKFHLLDALRYIVARMTQPVEGEQAIYNPVRIGPGW